MKLKIRTTAGAALGVAAMAAALSIGCGTLLNLGLPRILIVTGSVFTVMYLTARFCFNLFVRYRIKPIYQVLLSKNVKTHELPPAGDLVEDRKSPGSKRTNDTAKSSSAMCRTKSKPLFLRYRATS